MERTTYAVRGMTCEHCRVAVRQEVGARRRRHGRRRGPPLGPVTVEGDDVSPAAVAAAVEEAGYEVIP